MLEVILLTLIVIIAFVATSWYTHQRSQERANAFERELDETRDDEAFQQRFDALFEQELHDDEKKPADAAEDRLTDTPDSEPDLFDESPKVEATTQAEPEQPQASDWDMVVAFTIMAPEGRAFTGRAVKAALESHDLHFGDMQIFHKPLANNRKQTLFSVANILDPGTLLPDKFVSMTTPGLLVFARLPGPVSGLALFDDMLETAQGMSDQLGGILCDESREPVSDTALEAMRSKILNYQMSAQTESDAH